MGCDIHGFVEIKGENGWERLGKSPFLGTCDGEYKKDLPFAERDYTVFTVLAGVRREEGVPAISEPAGMPDFGDTCLSESEYAAIMYDPDYHSHSFLSVKEINDFMQSADLSGWSKNSRRWFEADLTVLNSLGNPDDVRFVFWFDN